MNRPPSVTIASWIWLFCALFTTFTIVDILTATTLLPLVTGSIGTGSIGTGLSDTGLSGTGAGLAAGEAIGRGGWLLVAGLSVAMVAQAVAAVRLRDGARWSRVVLSIAAGFSVLPVLYDMTMGTAWLLVVANAVAVALAESDSALDYLEVQPRHLVSA